MFRTPGRPGVHRRPRHLRPSGRRRTLPGECDQPRGRPQVLLPVAAAQQFVGEQPVDRVLEGQDRDRAVVEPVASTTRRSAAFWSSTGRARAAPRTRRRRAGPRSGSDAASRGGRAGRRSRPRSVRGRPRRPAAPVGRAERLRRRSAVPAPVSWPSIRTVVKRAARPWISRRKSAAAKRPSPSRSGSVLEVAASGTPASASFAEQRADQHRVPGVVEFELVDADQAAGGPGHRPGEAERAHQVRVLDEGAVGLLRAVPGPGRVPQRGEQVGLADAIPAVEIDAARGPARRPCATVRAARGGPPAARAASRLRAASCEGSAGSGR